MSSNEPAASRIPAKDSEDLCAPGAQKSFTPTQYQELQFAYNFNNSPTAEQMALLADKLQLSHETIWKYFEDRRKEMEEKTDVVFNFTPIQIEVLQWAYKINSSPIAEQIILLADGLQLSHETVKKYFEDRRKHQKMMLALPDVPRPELESDPEVIRSLPLRDKNSMILTDNLSKRIKLELKTRKISRTTFAEKVLGISRGSIWRSINVVIRYDRCREERKRRYEKMLEWLEQQDQTVPLISDKARADKRKLQEDSEDVESKKMKLAVVPVASYQQPYQQQWNPMFNPYIHYQYHHYQQQLGHPYYPNYYHEGYYPQMDRAPEYYQLMG